MIRAKGVWQPGPVVVVNDVSVLVLIGEGLSILVHFEGLSWSETELECTYTVGVTVVNAVAVAVAVVVAVTVAVLEIVAVLGTVAVFVRVTAVGRTGGLPELP